MRSPLGGTEYHRLFTFAFRRFSPSVTWQLRLDEENFIPASRLRSVELDSNLGLAIGEVGEVAVVLQCLNFSSGGNERTLAVEITV